MGGLSAEEKEKQLKKTKDEIEGEPLTEEEEYTILIGKGVQYKMVGGMEIAVPQLSIYEFDRMYEIDKAVKEGKNVKEILDIKIKIFAEITGTDEKKWHEKDAVDFTDIKNIHDIINFVFAKRRDAFEKKTKISKKEIQKYSTLKNT